MKNLQLYLCLLLAILLPRCASAYLVGPYTPDTNTLFLLHLDEASGALATTNVGSLGGNFIPVNYSSTTTPLPVETSMLGAASYSTNSPTVINFTNCEHNTTAGYLLGYDYNRDGIFEPDTGTGTSVDFLTMNKLNIGNGGQTPFTLEAIIKPTSTAGNQEIICTDSDASNRGFQFRISSATLMFQFITGGQALSATIPTTGPHAFVANTWYHVAFTYDGTIGTLYWTRLDPSVGAANVIASGALTLGASDGTVTGPLCIGNRGRPTGSETFLGNIDEVRISSVARAANQMQFVSPVVTITQNPVSQNVDYNQPVSFAVQASSSFPLGYQWLFNSNNIAGATNATYTIPNVAAANAGYYYCVVTNTAAYSATSSVASMVVGAANFLYHRYSFLTNANDSVGTANGTLFGDATATNGVLTLDGTTGTYMQLPTNIVNGASQTAFTVESWATYGVNTTNSCLFSFGFTNDVGSGIAHAYLAFSPNVAGGQEIFLSPSDPGFGESLTAPGSLDGQTIHVACVIDPPNQAISIYTNGVLEAVNTNAAVGLANVDNVYSYIGKSLNSTDPYLVANINELRLYSGALSALTLAQTDVLGPGQPPADGPAAFVREPVSTATPLSRTATFSAAATGYLPITYQWFKNGAPISGATNASYSYTPTLGDNGAIFVVNATNTIGVTTYVANSSPATLTVFVPPTLAWLGTTDGGQDNTWNTTSLDWTNAVAGGGVIAYAQTNVVVFDDRSGGGSVDLEQTILPFSITVNTADGYMFTSSGGSGLLAGVASLTKTGTGTLNIDVSNSLSGPVTISSGELQVGNDDSSGSLGSSPVTNNAILSINRGDTALIVGNSIHGTGTLSFDGSGAVTLSGNSDYSGGTLLNAGIVDLTSATGLGATSGAAVASGAQLYITANVNVPQSLTLVGAGDGNGALRKGGAGATTETAPIYLASATTIGVDSGATLTLSNVVSGIAGLTGIGSGTLALSANNSFNGGFTLNGPVVDLNAIGALGSGPVAVSGAGRFILATGLNFTNFLDATTVNPGSGQGLLMVNDNTNGIVTTISGPIEFDGSPSSGGDFIGPASSGYLDVTGPLTNTVTGDISSRLGLVRYSGGGNYTTFTLNGGTASLGANNGLCTNASMLVGSSGAAIFDLNGFSQTLTGLTDGAATPNSELVTNNRAAPATVTLDLSGANTYSGVIAGNIALVENGSGSLYLAGTNTYTGNTTVNGGTLELAQPGLAANSTMTVAGGAVLQLDFTVTNQVAAFVTNGISAAAGLYSSANASPYLAGSGYLLVQPGPSGPAHLTNSITGSTLILTWPAGQGWRLVSQTNSLSTGLNPNPAAWSTVPVVTDGNATLTVDPTQPAVFYELVYP